MSNKKILLIFIFAFLIRLIALNQSLWLDEAITASVVKNFSFLQIITKFSPTDFHPPLYYLFMKLWTNIFGYSETALRMPSVLFSLGTGWVVYLIGGALPAILFLFNPLIIYYSQEARMYMMVTFFLTVALYYFLKNKNAILFNSFVFLSLLTFYGSVFLITAFLIYFLYKKQYKNLFICLLVVFVYSLTISPLLYQQLINSKVALSQVTNWSLVLGKANLKNLFLIPIKFSIGRISFYPKWLYWGIAGTWTAFILIRILFIRTAIIKRVRYLLIFPLLLGFVISFFTPMLQYFRFIYLIPILCLILGFSPSSQPWMNLRGSSLVGGFLIFSLIYLLLPQFHREDWKSLVKSLPKNIPVYMILSSSDPVKYYDPSLNVLRLESLKDARQREILVIPYTAGIYGLDYKTLLNKNGYQLNKEVSFREITYERWAK
jgi:uncharacterized membrane protein